MRFYWALTKLVVAIVLLAVANLAAPGVPALTFLTIATSFALVLSVTKPWGRLKPQESR